MANPPVYNPNVPEFPSDTLASTQGKFLNNFMEIARIAAINHVPLTSSTIPLNHTIIQLTELPDSPQIGLNDVGVYTKQVMVGDEEDQTDQLFMKIGANPEFQLSNYQIYNILATATLTQYFTFLPGKILVYFGSFTSLTNNQLPLIPPVAKRIISVSMTPIGSTPGPKLMVRDQIVNNGFVTALTVQTGVVPIIPSSYLVMANL